jgi:hypothetical protein
LFLCGSLAWIATTPDRRLSAWIASSCSRRRRTRLRQRCRLADQLGWRQDIQVLRSALKTFPDADMLARLRKRLRLETKLARC